MKKDELRDLACSSELLLVLVGQALQIQRLPEARGSTRYIEMMNAHFGVRSVDEPFGK